MDGANSAGRGEGWIKWKRRGSFAHPFSRSFCCL